MPDTSIKRIAYIDWLRGFACLVMFQTHCYDSWLSPAARDTGFFRMSQLGGTLPAPMFLFLAGTSLALVVEKLRQKGATPDDVALTTILRGGEIFLLGMLFRVQEFVLGQPRALRSDILRVDVLNVIGVSLMMLGIACRIAAVGSARTDLARLRRNTILTAMVSAAAIAICTPALWTTWRPRSLTWWLESYINGVHTFDKPQSWEFPIFPWAAFAFAGLAVGSFLLFDWARNNQSLALLILGVSGVAIIRVGLWLDARPVRLYGEYDFWHTSPNFFLVRTGIVMIILFLGYAWCRWGPGEWGFSPLIEMGKCSLLVYWVHIEFVYGGLSVVHRRASTIQTATLGLLFICLAMTLLAVARNRFPRWKPQIVALIRGAERT